MCCQHVTQSDCTLFAKLTFDENTFLLLTFFLFQYVVVYSKKYVYSWYKTEKAREESWKTVFASNVIQKHMLVIAWYKYWSHLKLDNHVFMTVFFWKACRLKRKKIRHQFETEEKDEKQKKIILFMLMKTFSFLCHMLMCVLGSTLFGFG